MFKFLHAADVHLDSPLRGLEAYEDAPLEEIRGATRRAFDNLITCAIEQKVHFLLLAGDIFDGDWKDYNSGLYFIERLARLDRAGIRVVMVRGNHDAASQVSKVLTLPANTSQMAFKRPESLVFEDIGCVIHGQGYSSRALTDNLVEKYPAADPRYFNIGLLHTSLTGRAGHEPYAPCSLQELQSKGYDYWALGHVHSREVVAEDPLVVFPGCLQGRNSREVGPKGATLVEVENGQITTCEHIELDVLRWFCRHVDMNNLGNREQVTQTVSEQLIRINEESDGRISAVRLILSCNSKRYDQLIVDYDRLVEEFRAAAAMTGGVWLEKVQLDLQSGDNVGLDLDEETSLENLLGAVNETEVNFESLLSMAPELTKLRGKLPLELVSGDDTLFPEEEEKQKDLCMQVQKFLSAQIAKHGKNQ